VDSAGTHAYHTGEPPDNRASKTALKRGISLAGQRARRVSSNDFDQFDYVLAMDSNNLQDLLSICPDEHQHKVKLFLSYAEDLNIEDVPDPYYGGRTGFERVLDMVEEGAQGLLGDIRKRINE
jgi:protein-tyrosine phosphatase